MGASRPITLRIAALGGEGGGVLTEWIVSAAAHAGYPVQSTSIPGVAQRTGATTYYIEILPVQAPELEGKRPVFALTPGVGDIDVAVASELLEAGKGHIERVRSHRQSEKAVRAIVSGDGFLREVGLDVRDPDVGVLKNGLRRIADHAKDRSGNIGKQKAR